MLATLVSSVHLLINGTSGVVSCPRAVTLTKRAQIVLAGGVKTEQPVVGSGVGSE